MCNSVSVRPSSWGCVFFFLLGSVGPGFLRTAFASTTIDFLARKVFADTFCCRYRPWLAGSATQRAKSELELSAVSAVDVDRMGNLRCFVTTV